MYLTADQFLQVKCKFQLTSETESSESIHLNNEKIRLCASADLDKNSTLIVMVCCNESGNNIIVAYYIENCPSRPRIIIKQIFYHHHNEDISAICLSDSGSKLTLISASSTIYIIPIKNILLNLHAKQLRSSQRKSMYFYDASIIDSCSLEDPNVIAYWENEETENDSLIVVANKRAELCFISTRDKKVLHKTNVNEPIKSMKILVEQSSSSLLITCYNSKQYRFALESVKQGRFIQIPHRSFAIDKMATLDPDETIEQIVQTNRFLAVATDRDRCMIYSRNCYNLKNSSPTLKLDPLMKEVTFNNEEKILQLLKSPVINDQDNIIDSFLLVTTRSIYSIEPRQNCREMYINLIDSHLGVKQSHYGKSEGHHRHEFNLRNQTTERKTSESSLLINSFLTYRDQISDRISHDSRTFSILFKVELNSLYEAYGDKSLIGHRYELANRFYQLAKFDHIRIVGKYMRMGAIQQVVDYITNVICSRFNESTDDSSRIWCNYINFYLTYVGGVNELKEEIFNLIDKGSLNCRAIIALFGAIKNNGSSLEHLFDTVFLMKILEKTLELVPQSTDIEALSDMFGVF